MTYFDGLPSVFVDRCNVCLQKHEPKCDGHLAIAGALYRERQPIATRAAMVRLVVAQQWASLFAAVTATVMLSHQHGTHSAQVVGAQGALLLLGDLPCAVDVVADLMGAE